MKKNLILRLLFIIGAFSVAVLFVYILAIAGNKSKGPIQNAFNTVEDNILEIENYLIHGNRKEQRREKLKLFNEVYNLDSLKNPSKILLGASDNSEPESFEKVITLEDSLDLVFPIISIYSAWGSKKEEQFPLLASKTIISLGSVPSITWEPWLSDFDEAKFPGIPEVGKRGKGSLKAIASGTYDSYIEKWAMDAKSIEKPFFLRFGHEMNDPYRYPWGPQNNKPADFVDAWKHIYNIFDSLKVNNVIWVWAPHPSYGYFDYFYPGDDYVDYVGIGILNFGEAVTWSDWWTFDQLFSTNYEKFSSYGKPIAITEFGSLVVGGNRSKWFADALRDVPEKFPQVKSIIFFHYPADETLTSKVVSWYFVEDTDVLDSIKTQINAWNQEF